MTHIVVAPRSRVAYNVGDYDAAQKVGEWDRPDPNLVTGVWNQVEKVSAWQAQPPEQILLFDFGGEWNFLSFLDPPDCSRYSIMATE